MGSKEKTVIAASDWPALAILWLTHRWGQLLLSHVLHKHGSHSRLLRQSLCWAHHQQGHPLRHKEDTWADAVTSYADFNNWPAKKSLLPKHIWAAHIFQLNVSPLVILEWRFKKKNNVVTMDTTLRWRLCCCRRTQRWIKKLANILFGKQINFNKSECNGKLLYWLLHL